MEATQGQSLPSLGRVDHASYRSDLAISSGHRPLIPRAPGAVDDVPTCDEQVILRMNLLWGMKASNCR